MRRIDRKLWGKTVVSASLIVTIAVSHGFAAQPNSSGAPTPAPILSQVVGTVSAPTTTTAPAPTSVAAQSTPTSTADLKSAPAATLQSLPTTTETPKPAAITTELITSSSPTTTAQPTSQPTSTIMSSPTITAQVALPFEDHLMTATTATLPIQKPEYSPLPGQIEKDSNDRTGGGKIPESATLTLTQCIDIALGKNPTILAAINTVGVNESRLGEARAVYFPQLSAVGIADKSKPAPLITGEHAAEINQYSARFVLSQTLFDFGRTWSNVNFFKHNLEASRGDLNTTEDTIIQNVKQAYFAVLQAKRNRDVAADVIKQFKLHLEQAQGFYEVGTAAKIDVIKAQVDLSNAKLNLINTDNALKIAWVNLNNAMGVPNAPSYAIEDNLSFVPYVITLEDATGRAFENRPDLKAIIARRQAAEQNVSLQRSGYLPTLTANGSYGRAGNDVPPTSSTDSWNIGVTLNIPLFNGFLTTHQVAEAKSSLYVVRANEESVRQQVLLDVRQAYLNLQAAEARIPTAELALAQAKENLDIANGRYGAGVGSPIEVSDAFATYVTAQASYNNALYSYKIAQANIEKAMGAR